MECQKCDKKYEVSAAKFCMMCGEELQKVEGAQTVKVGIIKVENKSTGTMGNSVIGANVRGAGASTRQDVQAGNITVINAGHTSGLFIGTNISGTSFPEVSNLTPQALSSSSGKPTNSGDLFSGMQLAIKKQLRKDHVKDLCLCFGFDLAEKEGINDGGQLMDALIAKDMLSAQNVDDFLNSLETCGLHLCGNIVKEYKTAAGLQ